MADSDIPLYFKVLNEIGIIEQLGRAAFEARLPEGFVLPHFTVLNHLVRVQDGQTPLTIAQAFQIPKTSLTHTLAGLERHGLVEMRPNPADARSKQVWLTEKGRQFREQAIASMAPSLMQMQAAVSPDEMRELLPKLEALRKFMDQARDG